MPNDTHAPEPSARSATDRVRLGKPQADANADADTQRQRQKKAIKEETEPRLKIDLATSQRSDPTTVFTL